MNEISTNDERLGLPSASTAEQRELCPGSYNAQRGLPNTKSDYADTGTRIHLAWAGEVIDLTDAEQETLDRGKEIEKKMLDRWKALNGFQDIAEHHEERLWWHWIASMEACGSGQADVFWAHQGGRVLLEDLKSLWGDVTESGSNLQLRELAALMYENFDATEVSAFINQPRVSREPVLVVYNEDDLRAAHREMVGRWNRNMEPDAQRIAGPKQCQWCRAKSTCPEARAELVKVSQTADSGLSGVEVADLLTMCELADMVVESVRVKARIMLAEDPSSIPGWGLKPGATRRTVEDTAKAFELLSNLGLINSESFVAACSLKIGELESQIAKFKGMKKTEAKANLNKALETVIEEKQNRPSLVKIQ